MLEEYYNYLRFNNVDAVFGVTKFQASSSYQKTLRASTYGRIGHYTVPGTIIRSDVFEQSSGFMEHVRMGEDIEWRERLIRNNYKIYKPQTPILSYNDISHN